MPEGEDPAVSWTRQVVPNAPSGRSAGPNPSSSSLLSLPDELLVRVARELAPDGGRRVASLRLLNRRLSRIVGPIVWESIVLPSDAVAQDAIISHLILDQSGLTSRIASVVYHPLFPATSIPISFLTTLPNLSHIHFVGDPEHLRPIPSLATFLEHRAAVKRLQSISFSDIDLSHSKPSIDALSRTGNR